MWQEHIILNWCERFEERQKKSGVNMMYIVAKHQSDDSVDNDNDDDKGDECVVAHHHSHI